MKSNIVHKFEVFFVLYMASGDITQGNIYLLLQTVNSLKLNAISKIIMKSPL